MHDAHHFLVNIALVLCVAAVTTVIFQRLRQPVVLGYLLAGAIVSPHTPFPLFADEATIHTLSELGVILLMFSLGLEFSFAKLFRVGPTAGLVAVIQCSFLLWLGYVSGQLFGWTALESLYGGALIAISSTTIIIKAFAEGNVRGKVKDIVFGVLIVEDLIAIFLLAVLTPISAGMGLSAVSLAATTGKLLAFLAFVIGGGMLVVPRLMRSILRLNRSETTLVASVGLCFAFALVAQWMGYSVALGAFLAGALVAESGDGERIEHLIGPVRDMFAAIFFVAVGMLINPALIAENWAAVVVFTLVVVVGKVIGVAVAVFLTGQGIRTSIEAGMSLAQIGEFSFIIAGVGQSLGATRDFLYPLAVAVSASTTLLTPWLIRASDPAAAYVDRHLPKPIQTFAALYGTWVERLRRRPREATMGRRIRSLSRLLVIDGVALGAIVMATSVWGRGAARLVGTVLRLPDSVLGLVVLIAAGVLGLPFCVGIARCATALAQLLAMAALPHMDRKVDTADAPRRALAITIEIAILLLIGVPLVALTQPFLPPLPGATVIAVIIALLVFALWRSVANLQQHARAGAEVIVEVLSRQSRSAKAADPHEADLTKLDQLLPGLGAPVAIRLGADSPAAGRTLAELNLRGLTGATVLAIVRGGDGVLIPTGAEKLRPDDLLATAGTTDAIDAARRLLSGQASPE
jgi:monovalent cation:H+ antiporter-2, CPA2 family